MKRLLAFQFSLFDIIESYNTYRHTNINIRNRGSTQQTASYNMKHDVFIDKKEIDKTSIW